jgi:hypothetical protein
MEQKWTLVESTLHLWHREYHRKHSYWSFIRWLNCTDYVVNVLGPSWFSNAEIVFRCMSLMYDGLSDADKQEYRQTLHAPMAGYLYLRLAQTHHFPRCDTHQRLQC